MGEQELLTVLSDIGLKEKEARVYYAALSCGPTTAMKLARAAGVRRTTVYSIIDTLKQKGVMLEEVRGFRRLFAAQHPERLAGLLEQKRSAFQALLPALSALYTFQEGEGAIKFYEGFDAVKEVYESLLRDIGRNEDYMIVSNMHHWYHLDAAFFQDFTERRAALARKLNFRIRLLVQECEIAKEHKKIESQLRETIKFLPETTSLTTNLVIIPKKVVIQQLVPPIMAMVIENRHVIRMHRELFEIMWEALP